VTPNQVVDDGKYHGAAKHDAVPVHGRGSDWKRDGEKDKDPDDEQERDGSNIDKDASRSQRPSAGRQRAPETAQNQAGERDDVGSQKGTHGE